MRPRRQRSYQAGPALLPAFFAGTLAMVVAVVAIARANSDWADLAGVALLVAATAFLLWALGRRLADDEEQT